MTKHINIPIFIPHLGCPNQCVFCNQRSISGTLSFCEDGIDETVGEIITASDARFGDNCEREIAFFGGSFTGIDRALMIRLLDKAQGYVASGKVAGIRMSTRPDYISAEILDILSNYTISAIELGLQSFSDNVLTKSKRGHTIAQAIEACRMITERTIPLVGQMMIGLPDSQIADEIRTAEMICDLGASAARVYPAVVFHGTELKDMTDSGEYRPLSVEDAVDRTKAVLKIFDERGVECIRIGLCESENLHAEETYAAGPNHAAIGEMARSELYYDKICAAIDEMSACLSGKTLTVHCPSGAVSQITGQKKRNKIRIQNKYNVKKVKVIEMETLKGYNIVIDYQDI